MAGERIDYTAAAVEAARSVLIELTHILGEYRDDMVLVGGWIPELLIPQSQERHVGSIDVDLALNHKELTEAGYRMIEKKRCRFSQLTVLLCVIGSARGAGDSSPFAQTGIVRISGVWSGWHRILWPNSRAAFVGVRRHRPGGQRGTSV